MKKILTFVFVMLGFWVQAQTEPNILYDDNVTNSSTVLEWDNLDSLKAYTPNTTQGSHPIALFQNQIWSHSPSGWFHVSTYTPDSIILAGEILLKRKFNASPGFQLSHKWNISHDSYAPFMTGGWAGYENIVNGGAYNTTFQTYKSTISNGDASLIIGGGVNIITNGNRCTIINGYRDTLQGVDNFVVGEKDRVISGNKNFIFGDFVKLNGSNNVIFGHSLKVNESNKFIAKFSNGYDLQGGGVKLTAIVDETGATGTTGQVLERTATGLKWVASQSTIQGTYANHAAADADATLPSGSRYQLTGDRTVYIKP